MQQQQGGSVGAVDSFRAVQRGRYRQLVHAGSGRPVDVALYGCTVDAAPRERGGKLFVSLDIGDAAGDGDVLKRADDYIQRVARPAYSPVASAPLLLVKMYPLTRFEDEAGVPVAARWPVERGQAVDVVLRPGAFGDFGYCLLLQRIKPHALRQVGGGDECDAPSTCALSTRPPARG